MPDNHDAPMRQGFRYPHLRANELLQFFAGLAPHLSRAKAVDLRFEVASDLGMVPFLPHWNAPPVQGQGDVIAMRDILADVYQAALSQSHDLSRRGAQSANVEGMIDGVAASVIALFSATVPAGMDPGGPAASGKKICALVGDATDLSERVSQVARRSRHSAVSVLSDKQGDPDLVVIRLSDDPDEGATLDGLRALAGDSVPICAGIETSGGTIWLPDRRTLPRDQRSATGAVLAGLVDVGHLPGDHDLLVLGDVPDELVFAAIPRQVPALNIDDLASDPTDRIRPRVRELTLMANEDAQAALQARIVDAQFPVGYRVSLRAISETTGIEADIETLREEIEERQAEIELIRALAAPQMGLLRFSDAQLPALVDGLRAMPPAMVQNGGLTYAAGHAAGRAEPVHFILYDPARVAIEGRLPEHFWRGRTEDRPIRYWLDPHAAVMQQTGADPMIFTPVRHRLLPAINSFGGYLKETLGVILSGLFADASAVLGKPDTQPIYVFSPPQVEGSEMEVELLDRAGFQPLHLSIRWINDYMMVRSPRIAARAVLERLADDLYEGQAAAELRAGVDETVADLAQSWAQGRTLVSQQIGEVLGHVTQEIRQSAERMRLGHAYLGEVRKHVGELDGMIALARKEMAKADSAGADLHAFSANLLDARFSMVADLLAEMTVGDAAVEEAERRLQEASDKVEALLDQWGYS